MKIAIVVPGEMPTPNRNHEEWRASIETAIRYISTVSSEHNITLVLSGGKTVSYLPSEAECGRAFVERAYPELLKRVHVLLEEKSRTTPEKILYSKYVLSEIAPDMLVVVCRQSHVPRITLMVLDVWEYVHMDFLYLSVPDNASWLKRFFETVFLTALSHLDPRGLSFPYTLLKKTRNG